MHRVFGEYHGNGEENETSSEYKLNDQERKALKVAGLTLLVMILVLVAFCLPANSVMRAEDGTLLGNSRSWRHHPNYHCTFLVPSVVYGHMTGVYHGEKDVCNAMGRAMGTMSSYIALTFVAAQFINFFGYTKLGTILALKGAEFFRNSGIGTIPTMILFVFLQHSSTCSWVLHLQNGL